MPLDAQERRNACSLQAFGPDETSSLLEDLRTELINWNGPNRADRYRFTGPEQGLVRDGRAAPDVIDTRPGQAGACGSCGAQNPATTRFCGQCGLGCGPPLELDRWGDYTIVSLSVLANFTTASGVPATRQADSFDPATLTTCPFLKARVSSPQWKGPIWIDIDRTIVLPVPRLCVDILAPSTWRAAENSGPDFGDLGVWNVWVMAKICRAACCPTGLPTLTEHFALEADQVRTIPRRRGARRVWFSSQPVIQQWDLVVANTVVGSVIVPANSFIAVDLAPGVTAIRNIAFPALRNVVLTWEVQP